MVDVISKLPDLPRLMETPHTSSSLEVRRATSSTDGGAGLTEGGAMVGGALPGGAPGGGRRPGGATLAFPGVVEGDAGGESCETYVLSTVLRMRVRNLLATRALIYGPIFWRFPRDSFARLASQQGR